MWVTWCLGSKLGHFSSVPDTLFRFLTYMILILLSARRLAESRGSKSIKHWGRDLAC